MFNKKNLILIIILAILAGGGYLYAGPYQTWQAKKKSADSANWLAAVDMSLVNRIEVTDKDGKTHAVKKENNLWRTEPDNWPTEKIITDALEEKLTNLTKANLEIASFNKDNKNSFETGGNGLKIKLFQNDAEAGSFIMGKIASDYGSTYIGRDNDERTYRAPITFVRAFDVESWRDRTILNLSTAGIDAIIFSSAAGEIELTNKPDQRGEAYWRATKPSVIRLSKEEVDDFLNSVTKLEANGIPEQNTDGTGLDKPALELRLSGQGIDETLLVGGKDSKSGEYWLQKESTGQIFLITEENKKELEKQLKDFR